MTTFYCTYNAICKTDRCGGNQQAPPLSRSKLHKIRILLKDFSRIRILPRYVKRNKRFFKKFLKTFKTYNEMKIIPTVAVQP